MHTDAYDALVNLKKYIRELSGEPIGRIACIRIIDEFMEKAVFVHGVNCFKEKHLVTGHAYLHSEEDDTPYDVDGVWYCGRCHIYLPQRS